MILVPEVNRQQCFNLDKVRSGAGVGLVVAASGKVGHRRQGLAVVRALGLNERVIAPDAADLVDRASEAALVLGTGRASIAPVRRLRRAFERSGPIGPGGRPLLGIMQPVVWGARAFDFVWAPAHDRGLLPSRARRITTLTAPSAVGAAEREVAAARLRPLAAPAVGVLIGGSTRSHRFGALEAGELADRLAAFALDHGATLLVTTSPRTGPAVAAVLRDRLADHASFIEPGGGDAAAGALDYAAILGLADVFVVTSDSVAMMSDAAATGRPILGWRLPGGRQKFERFYAGLEAHGALSWFDGDWPRDTYPPLDAARTIADALRSLVERGQGSGPNTAADLA